MPFNSLLRTEQTLTRNVVLGTRRFIGWRACGSTGGITFPNSLFPNGTELVNDKPIGGATNLLDVKGTPKDNYIVKTVLNGTETETSKPVGGQPAVRRDTRSGDEKHPIRSAKFRRNHFQFLVCFVFHL